MKHQVDFLELLQIDYEKYYAVLPMEEFNGIFLAF